MFELEGKVALVTGGARGIGRATALALADAGVGVAVNYQRNEEAAAEVIDLLKKKGVKAMGIRADVSNQKACLDMITGVIDYFGRIDILVNNAGITHDNLCVRMKEAEWHDVISTNLTGVFNCCQAVIKPFLKQKNGGRIINIASVAGIYGNSGQVNYAAAKAGVIALTKSLSKELGGRNITVNAIAPGMIETEMTTRLPERIRAEALKRISLGRFGLPEEVAEAVLFLAGGATYITGQILIVDGGLAL